MYRIDPDEFDRPQPDATDPAREYWALALVVILIMGLVLCLASCGDCPQNTPAAEERVEYAPAPTCHPTCTNGVCK